MEILSEDKKEKILEKISLAKKAYQELKNTLYEGEKQTGRCFDLVLDQYYMDFYKPLVEAEVKVRDGKTCDFPSAGKILSIKERYEMQW